MGPAARSFAAGQQCTLLVFIDDATGRLMHLQFVETFCQAAGKPQLPSR
jgi:hypothetical protein